PLPKRYTVLLVVGHRTAGCTRKRVLPRPAADESQAMKSIVFERFGNPAEVLECRDVPVPTPGPGEVRVRMLASPINPSDLLYVRGEYGQRPSLPTGSGFEGVGVVEEAGPGLLGRLRVRRRVAVLSGIGGNWKEHVLVPAR